MRRRRKRSNGLTGGGPTLLECMTFRFHGHVFGDADGYMDKAQKAQAIANDPIPRFRRLLIDAEIATEAELAAIEKEIADEIEEAISHALASPIPTCPS